MEGIPCLIFLDFLCPIFEGSAGSDSSNQKKKEVCLQSVIRRCKVTREPNTINSILADVDYVPKTLPPPRKKVYLIILEDNEAV